MIDKEELKRNQESFESLRKNNPELILNPKLKEEWDKFLSIFSEEKIKNLNIEDYVLDRNNPDGSFCYWMEVRLNKLGNMHGSFAPKFGLYLSKDTREYKHTKKFGKDKEEAFAEIKQFLIDLLSAGKVDDLAKIKENKLSTMLKGKILFLYYPDKFLSVLSDEHLNYFLNELEIPYSQDLDAVDKRTILLDFKNKDSLMKNWTNQQFSSFLYKFYRPPKKLPKVNDDKKEQEEISHRTKDISKKDKINYLNSLKSMDGEIEIKGKSYKRDAVAIAYLKELRGYKCQLCDVQIIKKNGDLYIEASHITAKHKKGSEKPDNILILCPNHHKEFDWGNRKIIKRTPEEILFKLNNKEYRVNLKLE